MPTATTVTGADIVDQARRVLGRPYVYGAEGPNTFDCSGLVKWCCDNLGLSSCPRTSELQFGWTQRVSTPTPGDLVFFTGAEIDPPPGHVGIVIAPGQMINAPFTGTVVRQDGFSENGTGVNTFMGYGRIPGASSDGTGTNVATNTDNQLSTTSGIVAGYVGMFLIIGFAVVAVILLILWMRKQMF